MVNRAHLARSAALVALATAISCRSINAPAGVDRDMAASIPADTLILAGVNLDELSASPLYPKLPPAARALAEPLGDARYLLVASNGKDIVAKPLSRSTRPVEMARPICSLVPPPSRTASRSGW